MKSAIIAAGTVAGSVATFCAYANNPVYQIGATGLLYAAGAGYGTVATGIAISCISYIPSLLLVDKFAPFKYRESFKGFISAAVLSAVIGLMGGVASYKPINKFFTRQAFKEKFFQENFPKAQQNMQLPQNNAPTPQR